MDVDNPDRMIDYESKYTFPNGGRPPVFSDPEDMQAAIRDYFQRGVTIKEVVNKDGSVSKIPIPTITGLVLWLGFADRSSFYNYEEKEEFSYTIKRARVFIESVYEEALHSGNVTGAIFALKNFGWKDKSELEVSGKYEDTRDKLRDFYNDRDGNDLPDDSQAADTPADEDA